jgi:hypothetical protein
MSVNVSKCSGWDRRVNELGDNEQACCREQSSRHIHRMLKRLFSKAATSEEARRTLRYVEPLNEVRTKLTDFFSILRGLRGTDRVLALLRPALRPS